MSKNSRQMGNYQLMEMLRESHLRPSFDSPFLLGKSASYITDHEKLSLFFTIVNESTNAIVITNPDKEIVYVNNKFEEISGYRFEEVVGKNPSVLKSNKTPVGTYREMHRKLEARKRWKGVFVNVSRDGNEYIEEAVIYPVMNDIGDVIFYMAEKKDITSLRVAEDNVDRLTHFDNVTELPNRAYFIEEANALTKFPHMEGNNFAILFADIDRFKELNDSCGHYIGDVALKEIAQRIESNIGLNDFVARIGGDEFVVVHRNTTDESMARLGKQIASLFDTPIQINEQEVLLSVSIGAAKWPQDGNTLSEVLSNADLAMYRAKASGLGFVTYSHAIGSQFHREVELSLRLKNAAMKGQFYLVYQPKVCLTSGEVKGMEALLRWKEPEFGNISPAEFIPIAEKYKMMGSIGKWVIQTVCQQIHEWKLKQIRLPRLAINISVQQLEHPDFYDCLMGIVTAADIEPSMFEIEVTESVLMSDPVKAMSVLQRLEQSGFCIAIDDFGTGFSSLSYLKKLNASILKIDKSFINSVTNDTHDQVIVKSIVDLAQNLGLQVVAEGVETKEQVDYLKSVGCDLAQGFYYYKPLMPREFITLIEKE
jgi:diguanylate cyclase (GGDEF)-like protein/PAS domain S-box-containing protein